MMEFIEEHKSSQHMAMKTIKEYQWPIRTTDIIVK